LALGLQYIIKNLAKENRVNPKFFAYKIKEVRNFLKIMKGKVTANKKYILNGFNKSLKELKALDKSKEEEHRDISAI
jgi:hypothetical protein